MQRFKLRERYAVIAWRNDVAAVVKQRVHSYVVSGFSRTVMYVVSGFMKPTSFLWSVETRPSAARPSLLDELRQIVCPVLARNSARIDDVRQIVFGVRKNKIRVTDGVVHARTGTHCLGAGGTPVVFCAASIAASLPVRPTNRLSKLSSQARSAFGLSRAGSVVTKTNFT